MSENSSKNPPKTSTQRVKDFRERKRKQGSTTTAMMLTTRGQTSLEVIKSIHKSSKVEGVEAALFSEAQRLCPTENHVHRLVANGLLSKKTAKAWLEQLNAAKGRDDANVKPI